MANKVKGRKLDPNFVSSQPWEIQYVATKFGWKPSEVREARKNIGRSRRKLYAYIRSCKPKN